MSRRVASTTFGLPSKRRTFWAVERPLGAACSSFTPLTASRHTWHAEQIRRMRNGMGRPRNWIAADVVRVADGVLAEHWDILQDEAARAEVCQCSALSSAGNADCIREQTRCSAFHISKACPPAYKVFFGGARRTYMAFNE